MKEMKKSIAAVVVILCIVAAVVPSVAQDLSWSDGNVTLTPMSLFQMIQKGQRRDKELSQKIAESIDIADKDRKSVAALIFRIEELERKVRGMQSQITILHSKCNKLERPELKK